LADIAVRKNRAEGSILGAFIADSIGSALEFRKVCTEEDVKMAMRMPGNVEPWFLEAGQVTDDSELAMCQLHAFSQMEQGRY
jgi:ADP-ribosylglycohydrolase